MPNIWLYPGQATATNILLSDPTVQRSGGSSATTVLVSGSQVATASTAPAVTYDFVAMAPGSQVTTSTTAPSVLTGLTTSPAGSQVTSSLGDVNIQIGITVSISGYQVTSGSTVPSVNTGSTGTDVPVSGSLVTTNNGAPTVVIDTTVQTSGSSLTTASGATSEVIGATAPVDGSVVTMASGAITALWGTTVTPNGSQSSSGTTQPAVDPGTPDVIVFVTGESALFTPSKVEVLGAESPVQFFGGGGGVPRPKKTTPKTKVFEADKPRNEEIVSVFGSEVAALSDNVVVFVGPAPAYGRKTSTKSSIGSFVHGNVLVKIEYELQNDEDELLEILSMLEML